MEILQHEEARKRREAQESSSSQVAGRIDSLGGSPSQSRGRKATNCARTASLNQRSQQQIMIQHFATKGGNKLNSISPHKTICSTGSFPIVFSTSP